MSCHSLLACRVSAERSADNLMGVPLYMILCFSIVAVRILSLSLTFAILIITCLGVGLFGFIFFGTLCAFCTWISVSFFKAWEIFSHNLLNTFLTPFSIPSPSGDPYNVCVDMLDAIPNIPSMVFLFLNLFFLFAVRLALMGQLDLM